MFPSYSIGLAYVSLCCFYFRSQSGSLANSVGYVGDGTGEFKSSHEIVCQIMVCLVKMPGCGEITLSIGFKIHVGY